MKQELKGKKNKSLKRKNTKQLTDFDLCAFYRKKQKERERESERKKMVCFCSCFQLQSEVN